MTTYLYILLFILMTKRNWILRFSKLPVERTVIVISNSRTVSCTWEGQGLKTIDSILFNSQPGPTEEKGGWNEGYCYCPEVFQHHLKADILIHLYPDLGRMRPCEF